jgi:hypothetical protein
MGGLEKGALKALQIAVLLNVHMVASYKVPHCNAMQ